ncbi:hypothetical protein JXJ21_08825 [candidate division KSB1 bacterium]|nr:hypothetical protein [candidate division KSB1 bacterium]
MSKERLFIDGHVHLYPEYDLPFALRNGFDNLSQHAAMSKTHEKTGSADPIYILLLTERYDCTVFEQLRESPRKFAGRGLAISATSEPEALRLTFNQAGTLYLIVGRQVVARENLEILALATGAYLDDRTYPVIDLVKKVNDANGIAVLNWAPGKWFFSRGDVVKKALDQFSPAELLLGDTSLRTTLWRTPGLMKRAQAAGFRVIAGSDPLPFPGEEKFVGSYGFSIAGEFDAEKPVASLRSLLKNSSANITFIGKRNGLFAFARREYKIMKP